MRFMPRRLYWQLVSLVSLIVVGTLFAYGWFTGAKQSEYGVRTMKLHAEVMAKNLAISCADYMLTSNYAGLETLLLRSAEFPDILEIQVLDKKGNIISNIIHTPGSAPRASFGKKTIATPSRPGPSVEIKDRQLVLWQPISTGSLLGWVRINRDMEDIYKIQALIWRNSLLSGVLGIFSSFILLLIVLRRPIGAIRRVTDFARRLQEVKGTQIPVERSSLEVEQLCESLNHTSAELHANEEQLIAERERLEVTLQSIGDGVIATDTQGSVTVMNKMAEELTGWAMDEATGRPLAEVFHIVNEITREVAENPVEKVLRTGNIIGLANHTALISREGRERSIADSAAPITDRRGKIIGVVLVFRDVTEKNRIEEELLRSRKLESLGILAGGIAHDFNNILTSILGNISIVTGMGNIEDSIFKRLETAEKAAERASDLAQQLLTFSRGGAPILKTAHVGDLVKETIHFSLSGSNVKADIEIPDDLWLVEIDEGQMSQVVQNLVINAKEAMQGGGTLKVRAENVTIAGKGAVPLATGKYIKITISDQGMGIPREHLTMIFDPYFTTKERGSGLGLATVHSIIRRHNGHITAESKTGGGATFHIYLPASRGGRVGVEATAGKPQSAAVNNKKILVMDDDELIRDFIGSALAPLKHTVDFAADGKEAIECYKCAMETGQPYDVVIMDLTTPGGMGGKETMKVLSGIDPGIKAIVSSGYSNDPVMTEFKKHGFKGIIPKPYKHEELIALLNQVIANG